MFTVLCEDGMGGSTVRGNSLIFLNVATIRKYINGYFHILKKKHETKQAYLKLIYREEFFLQKKTRIEDKNEKMNE